MEHPADHGVERREALLDEWVAVRAEIARLEARAADLLVERAEVFGADVAEFPQHRDAIRRSMVAEYAAAGRAAKGTVEAAFADAEALHEALPAVRTAWAAGTISGAHVRQIVSAAGVVREAIRNGAVAPETLGLFEAAVVPVAEGDSAPRTRVHARQVAAALVPQTVEERHRGAAAERCVTIRSLDDGLALLTAVIPEVYAVAIKDRLAQMAQVIRAQSSHPGRDDEFEEIVRGLDESGHGVFWVHENELDPWDAAVDEVTDDLPDSTGGAPVLGRIVDERTADQIRADLFVDLLLAADPTAVHGTGLEGIRGRVQVTVSAPTLTGTDDHPAELDGYGPMDAETARALAGAAGEWSRLFTDATGMVTVTDAYRPTEAMRRHLRARDQRCRFPGCRQPVHRCQIDHHHDHALGGPTAVDNLAHFCPAHHVLKHPDIPDLHRWAARQLPDGTIEWRSPLGRTYRDRAPRRVVFT